MEIRNRHRVIVSTVCILTAEEIFEKFLSKPKQLFCFSFKLLKEFRILNKAVLALLTINLIS